MQYSIRRRTAKIKIAYISDLHLEFREKGWCDDSRYHVYGGVTFPRELDCDVIVIAGDVHPTEGVRWRVKNALERHYKVPVIMVKGNHDYWYESFNDNGLALIQVDNHKLLIGACTFWTDLRPDPFAFEKSRGFSDFRFIRGMTVAKWQAKHDECVEALRATKPDIIVTHHAPSFESVSHEFYGDSYNTFFVSNHDRLVRELNPKIWIHGHVHSTWDYKIGDTRILCNPLGYPGEIPHEVDVKIVEVV